MKFIFVRHGKTHFNEIDCLNYEDIKNGCNKFYLRSGEDYKKFLRILNDMYM